MRIYVASSWRNVYQPKVVEYLRGKGHEVYDFRSPAAGDKGFSWSEIDVNWKDWTPAQYLAALRHPAAKRGFAYDMQALMKAEATVLVLPCGTSAHLEMGYAIGAKQKAIFYLPTDLTTEEKTWSNSRLTPFMKEAELMYCMADRIAFNLGEVCESLAEKP